MEHIVIENAVAQWMTNPEETFANLFGANEQTETV